MTGNVIDIYFDTHEEAVRFGRQRKEVYSSIIGDFMND